MATNYEQQLIKQYGQGMADYIGQQRALGKGGALKGVNVDKQDVARITAGYQSYQPPVSAPVSAPVAAPSVPQRQIIPSVQPIQPIQPIQPVQPPQFQFDPNKYLPGIQQQAQSIYTPQQAQIEALKAIQTSQTEQAKIRTKEDFAKQMEATIERINARGAFFGGGAIKQETGLAQEEARALTDINLQEQVAQAGFLAQQAGLNAAQTQYIQEQLMGAQGSAYQQWKDQYSIWESAQDRAFREQQAQQEQARYEQERIFKEQQAQQEQTRYEQETAAKQKELDRQYELDKKKLKMLQQEAKEAKKDKKKAAQQAVKEWEAEMALKYTKKPTTGKKNYKTVTKIEPSTGEKTTEYIYQ